MSRWWRLLGLAALVVLVGVLVAAVCLVLAVEVVVLLGLWGWLAVVVLGVVTVLPPVGVVVWMLRGRVPG